MNYTGTIIEESLENITVLKDLKILKTTVEPITQNHKTPWLAQWTLHKVEIPAEQAQDIAEKISRSIDINHANSWYADFKNEIGHYIIFRDKVFYIENHNPEEINAVNNYALSLGIPKHQLPNF